MEHVQSSGGGPWGGVTVDDKFFTMLRELIGGRVWDDFCSEYPMEEYDLRLDFEGSKREVGTPLAFPFTKNVSYLVFLS